MKTKQYHDPRTPRTSKQFLLLFIEIVSPTHDFRLGDGS